MAGYKDALLTGLAEQDHEAVMQAAAAAQVARQLMKAKAYDAAMYRRAEARAVGRAAEELMVSQAVHVSVIPDGPGKRDILRGGMFGQKNGDVAHIEY